MPNAVDCALATFVYEVGYLKRTPRTGWAVAGVPGRVESVAEHSMRTAVLAHVIALAEGVDGARAALLGLYHNVPETRTGDIPHLGRRYLSATDPDTIAKDQTAGLPEAIGRPIREVIAEFEAQQTREAVCARDADKLERLFQAREYQAAGATDLDQWIKTSVAALATDTARNLAAQGQNTLPGSWWRNAQSL